MYLKRFEALHKKYKDLNCQNFKKDFEKKINDYYEQNISEKLSKNLYHGVLDYERDIIQLQNKFI